jgi:hypothetical protein
MLSSHLRLSPRKRSFHQEVPSAKCSVHFLFRHYILCQSVRTRLDFTALIIICWVTCTSYEVAHCVDIILNRSPTSLRYSYFPECVVLKHL